MCELVFEDVKVPAENLLGKVCESSQGTPCNGYLQEGEGVVHMMRNLELERVTLAAMSVGIAERSVEVSAAPADTSTAHSFRR